ncbi:MAG: YggS family pyridoxal phosphate-dependent enzyme [Actinomycetota bacterium]
MSDGSLESNIAEVRARMSAAAERVGRPPAAVRLVAVTKTFGVDVLEAALRAGLRDLGENRAQELKQKAAIMGDDPRWHFIGHLQSNKARHVVGATLIHSVDRFGVAEAIARRAGSLGMVQDVLIEVNVSGEVTKHGVEPARVLALATEVGSLERVRLKGLMTMAPFSDDPESSRPYFQDLRELGTGLTRLFPEATELSMGMTRDFEVAIEEGATIVRVGEAIFGPRR